MLKRNVKTKTVLTMTDMTESTENQAFKKQKDNKKSYCKNFFVYLCCSILRQTQSPAKFTC